MRTGSRLRQITWAVALAICATLFVALTFRVNAVKSDVRLAEREIVALEREKMILEVEFQTRASQQQLADYNRVEFGYGAPTADQYLEGERQLSSLGMPRNIGAPDPIRVARSDTPGPEDNFPAMVSPLTGEPMQVGGQEAANGAQKQASANTQPMSASLSLSERLALDNPIGGTVAELGE